MARYVILNYCAQQTSTQTLALTLETLLFPLVTNLLEQRNSPSPLAGTRWTYSCNMMFRSYPEWYMPAIVCAMCREWGTVGIWRDGSDQEVGEYGEGRTCSKFSSHF